MRPEALLSYYRRGVICPHSLGVVTASRTFPPTKIRTMSGECPLRQIPNMCFVVRNCMCGPCTTTYCSTNAESKANLTYVVLVPTQLTMMPMMSLHCRITASRVQVGPKMKEGFQWVIDRAFPQV